MIKLIFIFTIIPLIELSLLIKISQHMGMIFAISLVAITGLIGATLAKKQGTNTLNKIRTSLEEGQMPADRLIDGLLILIGGVLLITPGLLTDCGGFACIIPYTRSKIKVVAKDRLKRLITTGRFQFFSSKNQETKTFDVVDEDNKDKKNK